MAEENIKVDDYASFDSAVATVNTVGQAIETADTKIKSAGNTLSSETVFMGPISDSCQEGFQVLNKRNAQLIENMKAISSYLSKAKTNYQGADENAKNLYLAIKDGKVVETTSTNLLSTSGEIKYTENIPDNLSQRGYTVTCYGKEGWWFSGTNLVGIARGSRQETVHEAWKKDGARYKDGIAVMNVNGQDCYLVATSAALGKVGDAINVTFKDGQSIPCVVADAKSSNDWNYTKYGHSNGAGSVNILEFEVDRHKYLDKGNPTTSSWGLEWDSSSGVKKVDNYGSVVS